MKLVCDRQELAEALALTSMLVSARTTRPILANVCLAVDGDGLSVLATDLEVGLRVRIRRVDIEGGPGRLLLQAAHAHSIVRELGDDKITIDSADGVAVLASGSSQFRVVAEDPEGFPLVPDLPEAAEVLVVERGVLEAMLRKTAFAAALEGLRYALNGVLFDLAGSRLRLVATDGKRLALCERTIDNPLGLAASRVVSNKAVQLLSRLAAPEDESLRLRFQENQLLAASSRAVLSAQLVQGHFPPYEDVIPKGLDKRVEIDTLAFQAALRRASLLTTKDSFAVRFGFTFNRLTLTSRSPGVGESKVELALAYPYDPLEAAFNPAYFQDALKVVDEPRVLLELKENTLPCVLREGEGYAYVLMPIELT